MRLFKHRSIGFYLGFVLLLTVAICTSVIAYASSPSSNTKVSLTIKGGKLTLSNSTNQVSLDVDRKVKLVPYSLPIIVTDARGSGSGWNLTITSTRFTSTNHKDPDKLPAKASQITVVNVYCAVHSTCTMPVNSVSYPLVIPAGDTPPAPVKFFNAAVNSGLGNFLLSMMAQVNIPANTKPGTYTCTVILSVVAGP